MLLCASAASLYGRTIERPPIIINNLIPAGLTVLAGAPKRELLEKRNSAELEQLMERRECYERGADEQLEVLISSQDGCAVVAEAPIITDGDVSGCVAFVSEKEDEKADEVLLKLCQSAAQFLSKRIAV